MSKKDNDYLSYGLLTEHREDTASPPADRAGMKSGENLIDDDLLGRNRKERQYLVQRFSELYGIVFQDKVGSTPAVISFTSRKCIFYDQDGNACFIKQKPAYSLVGEQPYHAAHLQMCLAEELIYIPPIIKTKAGLPYVSLHSGTYFLTPFIQGGHYRGEEEQSLAAMHALGEMHAAALRVMPQTPPATDFAEETLKFIELVAQLNFPNHALHQRVVNYMQQIVSTIRTRNASIQGWLHGDFAPFNLVFDRNTVIAVNDFDNVTYGPLARDIAECMLTHCGINYAGATSSMRAPIRTSLDTERMICMLTAYFQRSSFRREQFPDIPQQIVYTWLELLAVGLLRGDFSLQDVERVFSFWEILYQTTKEVIK